MLKLSITLPNNAQINLESEDETVIDRILGIVLADVTRALLTGISTPESGVGAMRPPDGPVAAPATPSPPPLNTTSETEPSSISATIPVAQPTDTGPIPAPEQADFVLDMAAGTQGEPLFPTGGEQDSEMEGREPEISMPAPSVWSQSDLGENGAGASSGAPAASGNHVGISGLAPAVSEQAFIDFCRAANPLGDMRRVVVAAEGASRYLAMDGVNAESLGSLFDIVGWPRAHNFVQTLRNAARSKFGWLERIPGRAGHYSVTDLGRSTALGR